MTAIVPVLVSLRVCTRPCSCIAAPRCGRACRWSRLRRCPWRHVSSMSCRSRAGKPGPCRSPRPGRRHRRARSGRPGPTSAKPPCTTSAASAAAGIDRQDAGPQRRDQRRVAGQHAEIALGRRARRPDRPRRRTKSSPATRVRSGRWPCCLANSVSRMASMVSGCVLISIRYSLFAIRSVVSTPLRPRASCPSRPPPRWCRPCRRPPPADGRTCLRTAP